MAASGQGDARCLPPRLAGSAVCTQHALHCTQLETGRLLGAGLNPTTLPSLLDCLPSRVCRGALLQTSLLTGGGPPSAQRGGRGPSAGQSPLADESRGGAPACGEAEEHEASSGAHAERAWPLQDARSVQAVQPAAAEEHQTPLSQQPPSQTAHSTPPAQGCCLNEVTT